MLCFVIKVIVKSMVGIMRAAVVRRKRLSVLMMGFQIFFMHIPPLNTIRFTFSHDFRHKKIIFFSLFAQQFTCAVLTTEGFFSWNL